MVVKEIQTTIFDYLIETNKGAMNMTERQMNKLDADFVIMVSQKDSEIRRLRKEIDYLQEQNMMTKKDDLVIHLNNQHQIVCRFDSRKQAIDKLEEIFRAGHKEIVRINDSRSQYLIKVGCVDYAYVI